MRDRPGRGPSGSSGHQRNERGAERGAIAPRSAPALAGSSSAVDGKARDDCYRSLFGSQLVRQALASGLPGLSTHKGWGDLPPYRPILRPPR